MHEDPEQELLNRVSAIENFCDLALFRDDLPDWDLARQFGAFLTRLGHDDLLAHLLLARAHRHLGEIANARAELSRCRTLISEGKASGDPAAEPLVQVLQTEERLLSS